MKIEICYRNEEVKELYKKAGIQTNDSAGFDLVLCEDIDISKGNEGIVDLGVIIRVPKGYHCLVFPRSSTFKKHGIIQSNSVGLIDQDYCGKDDFWKFPFIHKAYVDYPMACEFFIPKGTRICQFIIQKTIKIDEVVEFTPDDNSRGGFGSTGQ